jgi:hypothetical protein
MPTDSITDARLLFWFAGNAQNGDQYQLDDVTLTPLEADVFVPDAPTMLWPLQGAVNQPLEISLNWTKMPGVLSYEVELASDAGFEDIIDNRIVGATVTSFDHLPPWKRVYYKIRSIGALGAGSFSVTGYFETSGSSSVGSGRDIPTTYALSQNYPNPFNPSTRIRYSVPERTFVTIRVYNALGAQVAIVDEGDRAAGEHEVVFEATGLASGLYFFRLQSAGFAETRKMIVLR